MAELDPDLRAYVLRRDAARRRKAPFQFDGVDLREEWNLVWASAVRCSHPKEEWPRPALQVVHSANDSSWAYGSGTWGTMRLTIHARTTIGNIIASMVWGAASRISRKREFPSRETIIGRVVRDLWRVDPEGEVGWYELHALTRDAEFLTKPKEEAK